MKYSRVTLARISGLLWVAIGFFLLCVGLGLFNSPISVNDASFPLVALLAPYFGGPEQAVVVLIAAGLAVGFMKGKHVLGKSAKRGVQRLQTLPNPVSLARIYSAKYYILLGAMILLGMSIKYLGLPNDLRGFVDVAIGTALIQGGLIYFRLARTLNPQAVP